MERESVKQREREGVGYRRGSVKQREWDIEEGV